MRVNPCPYNRVKVWLFHWSDIPPGQKNEVEMVREAFDTYGYDTKRVKFRAEEGNRTDGVVSTIQHRLEEWLDESTNPKRDLVILYYDGHGGKDSNGNLRLYK